MSPSLAPGIRPTRIELLKLKRQEVLAQKGHDLLEEKLDAMTIAYLSYRQPYLRQKELVNKSLENALRTLGRAEMFMGLTSVEMIAHSIPGIPDIPMDTAKVMGVSVPRIPLQEKRPGTSSGLGYSILGTSAVLDEALEKFENLLGELLRLAELEGTITRINREMKRTRRRVNALEKIYIPQIQATHRYIEMHLEEREREDQFRRKRTKQLLKGEQG
ncbi:V/A-type H+-transporting ATPase subunit D [Methanolinea mesophila]|uniref:V-type ATP synthase subunit D n=1 Tax=Methanolinea mesophila TaxID=547055 RepID=UPI001AE0FE3B|nr:V-type ATP synthase subunit D [Methanolinea mesophila]MBP1927528.1 V/A-type H+-transporting ATPase subunit D [Methanolinea mesophila]